MQDKDLSIFNISFTSFMATSYNKILLLHNFTIKLESLEIFICFMIVLLELKYFIHIHLSNSFIYKL